MVRDALRGYLNLASGLTEVTVARAQTAARALVAQGEATAEQVTSIADDLVQSSRRNREAIVTLVRYEVDQALRRVGLAPAEEVSSLTERVRRLEAVVREALGALPGAGALSGGSATKQAAAGTTAAPGESAPAKKAPAKKTTAKKAPAKKTASKSTAKKAASKAAAETAGRPRKQA